MAIRLPSYSRDQQPFSSHFFLRAKKINPHAKRYKSRFLSQNSHPLNQPRRLRPANPLR
nr:MAG TPA: hypothetical protein [Caudoviricetes sp.]